MPSMTRLLAGLLSCLGSSSSSAGAASPCSRASDRWLMRARLTQQTAHVGLTLSLKQHQICASSCQWPGFKWLRSQRWLSWPDNKATAGGGTAIRVAWQHL